MRIGYDSTSPKDCPDDGEVYCGYIDGTYSKNHAEQKARHPDKAVWSVGRFTSSRANWYDRETGLLTDAQAVDAAAGNISRHEFAGIYCNLSSWPAVKTEVARRGLTGKVHYWIAWEHGGEDEIPAGAVGRQYLLSPGEAKGHYDKSLWVDYIPGLDAKPEPRPTGFTKWQRHLIRRHNRIAKNLAARLDARTHPLTDAAHTRLDTVSVWQRKLSAAITRAKKLK